MDLKDLFHIRIPIERCIQFLNKNPKNLIDEGYIMKWLPHMNDGELEEFLMNLVIKTTSRLIDKITDTGASLSAITIIFMALSIVIEIFSRLFFGAGSKWVAEYTMYGLVALTFFGAAKVEKEDANIKIDIITSALSSGIQKVLDVIVYILATILLVFLLDGTIKLTVDAYVNGHISTTILRTPLWIPYLFLITGSIIMLLQFFKKLMIKLVHLVRFVKDQNQSSSKNIHYKSLLLLLFILFLIIGGFTIFYLSGPLQVLGFAMMLFGLLFSGAPIFICFFFIGFVGFFTMNGFQIAEFQLAGLAYNSLESFTLGALPLFIFAGYLFSASGLIDKLFTFCEAWLSRLPGSLAMATIASCAIFSSLSGSSIATAASIGLIAIPAMIKRGYSPALACGSVAAAGTLGSMIPPSNTFIMYSLLTDTSLGELFIAGIIPGVFIALMFMIYVYFRAKSDPNINKTRNVSLREKVTLTKESLPVLLAPVIILGGIYAGIFTPTESAAIAVLYGFILLIIRKNFSFRDLIQTLTSAARTSAMILLIMSGALIFGNLITLLQITQQFTEWAVSSPIPPWGIIVVIMILTLVLGALMDGIALTMIVVPIVFSTVIALGFDPIWFGILFTLNMEIGLVSPPVGITLFTVQGISDIKFGTIVKGAFPFLIVMLICLIIIGLFEPISLWLPSLMN